MHYFSKVKSIDINRRGCLDTVQAESMHHGQMVDGCFALNAFININILRIFFTTLYNYLAFSDLENR